MRPRSALADAMAGAVCGLAATAAMSAFERAMVAAAAGLGIPEQRLQERMVESPEGERPTEKLAALAGIEEKERAADALHYAFGALLGAAYGVARGRWRAASRGRGAIYGAALWLGATETALPALRLSRPPADFPPSTHAMGLLAHVCYGLALDAGLAVRGRSC